MERTPEQWAARLANVAGYVAEMKQRFFLHGAELNTCRGFYERGSIPKVGASPDSQDPIDYNSILSISSLAEGTLRQAFGERVSPEVITSVAQNILRDLFAVAENQAQQPSGSATESIAQSASWGVGDIQNLVARMSKDSSPSYA